MIKRVFKKHWKIVEMTLDEVKLSNGVEEVWRPRSIIRNPSKVKIGRSITERDLSPCFVVKKVSEDHFTYSPCGWYIESTEFFRRIRFEDVPDPSMVKEGVMFIRNGNRIEFLS